jgi:metal-dependent amidase/aminoacylase/carboxypeptidase family protein
MHVTIGSDLTDFHHTARFDFDEASIETGVRLFAGLAERVSAWSGSDHHPGQSCSRAGPDG